MMIPSIIPGKMKEEFDHGLTISPWILENQIVTDPLVMTTICIAMENGWKWPIYS